MQKREATFILDHLDGRNSEHKVDISEILKKGSIVHSLPYPQGSLFVFEANFPQLPTPNSATQNPYIIKVGPPPYIEGERNELFQLNGYGVPQLFAQGVLNFTDENGQILTLPALVQEHIPHIPWTHTRNGKEMFYEPEILRFLALILKHIHTTGITHLDINPNNILLSEKASTDPHGKTVRPYIIDFNNTRSTQERARLYKGGEYYEGVRATPNYIPRELALPTNSEDPFGDINQVSDLYMLAITVYFILTGDVIRTNYTWESAYRESLHEEMLTIKISRLTQKSTWKRSSKWIKNQINALFSRALHNNNRVRQGNSSPEKAAYDFLIELINIIWPPKR